MTKTCPNCFSPNVETNKFCSNCGTPLQSVAATTSSASPGEETPAGGPSSLWSPSATSYVVKTTSDAEAPSGDAQAPTVPMSTFVPASSAGTPAATQYFASESAPGQVGPSQGYQGYVPGASSRKEGAAYMPYSAGSAAPLEKPKESRSFLMPIIVVAGLVLVALAVFSGWLVLNNKPNNNPVGAGQSPSPVPTAAAQATKVPANAPESDKVKEVIVTSNNEQIKAWRDLNSDILKGTRIGQVLTEQQQMVQQLKDGNMYAIPVNVELTFLDVKVNGDTATVRTKEIWTVTFYRKDDNKKIESRGPDTLTETYTLVKQNGKWLINKLVFDSENGTTPTPTRGGT
jgi:hypothetical protein